MSRVCSSDRMNSRLLGFTALLPPNDHFVERLPAQRIYDKITHMTFPITQRNR